MARIRRSGPAAEQRVHGDLESGSGIFAAVYALVRRIPRGRVMTYGQIATMLEGRLSPRAVGWAMHGCPRGVPWQRVVNARGGCSTERLPGMPGGLQQQLLKREGVKFDAQGRLDLEIYRYSPRSGSGSATTRASGSARSKRSTTSG